MIRQGEASEHILADDDEEVEWRQIVIAAGCAARLYIYIYISDIQASLHTL